MAQHRLTHDGQTYALKPTIGVGFALSEHCQGFRLVAERLEAWDLTVVRMILERCLEHGAGLDVEQYMEENLAESVALATQLYADIFTSGRAQFQDGSPGKALKPDDYLWHLFELGVGFLQWAPSEVYAATCEQLLVAVRAVERYQHGVVHLSAEEKARLNMQKMHAWSAAQNARY